MYKLSCEHMVSIILGINLKVELLGHASLVVQRAKHPPAMPETQVQSLGWEGLLEKEMATHSSTLAWKNPMDGEAW